MERSKRTTAERLKTLREIIKTEPTSTQQELVEKLNKLDLKSPKVQYQGTSKK